MSYTNTLNPSYMYKTYSYTPTVSVSQRRNDAAFDFDSRNYDKKIVSSTDLKIKQLKEEFQLAKDEQGCIGNAWNIIKNSFNTEYSSKNIENAINSLTYDSTHQEIENVKNMITKYRHKQDLAVDTIGTIGATVAGGTAGAKVGKMLGTVIGKLLPGSGTIAGGTLGSILGYIGGAILGAATKVGISQLENVTDNVDNNAFHNDKEIGKEILYGAFAGANAMLFDNIAEKVSGVFKNALKLTPEGIALSANGTANVAKTVCLNTLAEGIGGAAASVIICDGEYLTECALEEDTEFSWNDLVQTTGISAVTGGIISAGFGATASYKEAKNFNKFSQKTIEDIECSLSKEAGQISQNTANSEEYQELVDLSLENLIYECSFYRIEYMLGKWFKKSFKKVTALHGEKAFDKEEEIA